VTLLSVPTRRLRDRPWDIIAVILWTVIFAVSVTFPGVSHSPLRPVVALPYLLICPGYVTVAALIPWGDAGTSNTEPLRIGWWLRWLLSIGLSALVVSSIGYILVVLNIGFAPVVTAGVVSVFVLGVATIALVRRQLLDPEDRYVIPISSPRGGALKRAFGAGDRTEFVVNIVLVLSVLFLVSTLAFASVVPRDSEQYTELYVLTDTNSTASPSPEQPRDGAITGGDAVRIGIENQEHDSEQYELVATYHVRHEPGGGPPDRTELDRFTISLDHGETWSHSYRVPTTLPDQPVELEFRLFRAGGSRPEPYRETHLLLGNES